MVQQADFRAIVEVVKAALKRRGMTYKDFAALMEMPESTVKKMFIASDWSYSRLAGICTALDLDLADLLSVVKAQQVLDVAFTPKQEKLFAAEPHAFAVFWHLVFERRSTDEVMKLLKLPKEGVFRILRRLDNLKLLELQPGNVVKLPRVVPVRWGAVSPFLRELKQRWAVCTVADASDANRRSDDLLVLQYFQLQTSSLVELRQAVKELEDRFARMTARDMNLHGKDLVGVRMSLAIAKGSFMTATDS